MKFNIHIFLTNTCQKTFFSILSQKYRNKKDSKIYIKNKTLTLRKSYTFLNRVYTRREHININNYNHNDNKINLKKKKGKRESKKERIKTINIY